MALSEETRLLIKLTAEDATKRAFGDLGKSLGSLASYAVKVGAVLASAFAFKDVIQTTRQWNKELDLLVDTLGVTGAEAAKLNAIGRVVGLTADDTAQSFGMLSRKLSEQQKLIHEGTSDFDKWGVKVLDASGKVLGFDDILGNINATVGKMPSGLAKTAALMDLFGRSGKQMHDLVSLSREEIAALADDVDKLGLSMTTNGVTAAEQFERQFNRLGLTFDAFKITLGNELMPLLAQLIRNFVMWAKDVLPRLKETLGPIVSGIGSMAIAVFNLFGALGRVIGAVLRLITGERDLSNVTKVWGEALRRIATFLKEVADAADRFAQLIGERGIIGALKQLGSDLGKAVLKLLGDIGDKLDSFGPAGTLAKDALLAIGSVVVLSKLASVVEAIMAIPAALAKIPARTLVTIDVVLVGIALGEIIQTIQSISDHWEIWRTAAHDGSLEMQNDSNDWGRLTVKRAVEWGDFFDMLGTKTQEAISWWGKLFGGFFDYIGTLFHDYFGEGGIVGTLFSALGTLFHEYFGEDGILGKAMSALGTTAQQLFGEGGTIGTAFSNFGTLISDAISAINIDFGWVSIDRNGFHWHIPPIVLSFGTSNAPAPPGGATNGQTHLAGGGIITRPTNALIGESGPEAVIPLASAGGMGTTVVNNYFSNNIGLDERALARMVGDEILRTLGRNRALSHQ